MFSHVMFDVVVMCYYLGIIANKGQNKNQFGILVIGHLNKKKLYESSLLYTSNIQGLYTKQDYLIPTKT